MAILWQLRYTTAMNTVITMKTSNFTITIRASMDRRRTT